MLDPSLPWLAQGYKNFQTEDITKTHSYDDITSLYHVNREDHVKKELRSSTPELRQRRRVKSATYHRQLHRSSSSDDRPGRPKSAFVTPVRMDRVSRPGSSQSYYREKVGCYNYESEYSSSDSFKPIKPRPKSAIFLTHHRPSSLDRISVSQVERQFHKERMYNVYVDDEDNHCAFCPTDCRPDSSSSTRPTSSTGLVAAQSSTHYDRYTSWTRPRTAPSTKREFLQKPRARQNYVNRNKVPHYTNFIKRIDLGLRDETPSPPPPPRRRRAFEEPATTPSPPRERREPRERPKTRIQPIKPAEKPKPPQNKEKDEPVRIPTPIEPEPQEEEQPEEIPSAWAEPRAPTPTPTNSPPPEEADEEEERIPTPPPPREPTPPPPEEPKPSTPPPVPPREPTPPPPEEPPPPKEPTPPPSPPPQPEPPPPPQEPKPKKEVRIHDPPVVEPPPRPPSQKKEKKASNLVKRPVTKPPEPKPEPKPAPKPKPPVQPVAEPVELNEEPTPPVPKVEIPSLPEIIPEVKPVEEPVEILDETPSTPVTPKVEEPPKEADDSKKKQLGPPPKVKVDVFGRAMDPEYLLDLEMKSRRKGKQMDEDEDLYANYSTNDAIPDSAMKKSKMDSWLKGRMALSKRASRFELPMDVMELEGMNQITYLKRYCIVSSRRAALYRRAFNKVDRDCDLKINLKEMEKAIEDALVDTIHLHQIQYVLELIGADQDITIQPKLFSAICALLERLFYHEFVTEDTVEMEGNTKERVETADFGALDWKLEGCNVNAPLKKLLYRLL